MGGGILQLLAVGIQNEYLNGNPEITYFKKIYKRTTNFSVEQMEQLLIGKKAFGQRLRCKIDRKADLIKDIYLAVKIKNNYTSKFNDCYQNIFKLGYSIIDYVEIEIGGQIIDKQYGEWLDIWSQLSYTPEKYEMLMNLIQDRRHKFKYNNYRNSIYSNKEKKNKVNTTKKEIQIKCLKYKSSVDVISFKGNNKFIFNNLNKYNSNLKYGLHNGIYIFANIPKSNPIAILNKGKEKKISYLGDNDKKLIKSINGIKYNFYYGNIKVEIFDNFNNVSLCCYYNGYMNGKKLLIYSEICENITVVNNSKTLKNNKIYESSNYNLNEFLKDDNLDNYLNDNLNNDIYENINDNIDDNLDEKYLSSYTDLLKIQTINNQDKRYLKLDSSETDSNEIDSNETDSNEIDSNELDSNETDSNEIDSNEIDSNELDSNESESDDSESDTSEIDTSEIDTSEFEQDSKIIYIPLNFWFNKDYGLSLPLVALQYHEVVLYIKFKDLDKIKIVNEIKETTYTDLYDLVPSDNKVKNKKSFFNVDNKTNLSNRKWEIQSFTGEISDVSCYCNYIFLDADERKLFANKSHEYLIEQIQTIEKISLPVLTKSLPFNNVEISLDFNHPVKEIIWTINSKLLDGLNFYKNQDFSDIISDVLLLANNIDIINRREGSFYNMIQPFQYHTNGGLIQNNKNRYYNGGYYMYSFCLEPEKYQPSGTINFSRLNNFLINFKYQKTNPKFTHIDEEYVFNCYAINYNILKIENGMGGLIYSS